MSQVDTNSLKVRRISFIFFFWPASTLLHGHTALAIPSLLKTDPQILGALGFRWWGSPGQIIPSDGFWSRMLAWRNTALVNRTHRIGFSIFELFRKIDEDFGGSISWNTQPNCRVFFNVATALLSPFFYFLLGCSPIWRCTKEHFSRICILFLTCRTSTPEDAIFHRMELCKFFWGNPCSAVEPFSHLGFCLWDFWFSMHLSHSAA